MPTYEHVHAAWDRLSHDAHIGMSDAFEIVRAAENSEPGRLALAEILSDQDRVAIIDRDALSFLRISRDLPLPPGVQDHRADEFFRSRSYTGRRLSSRHRVSIPREFLYFDFAIVMIVGLLDEPSRVCDLMRGSGYQPVTVRRPDGSESAIGILMVNEFRDTTFGPYNEVIFMAAATAEQSPECGKVIDYVNAYSLQTALDRGAATFVFKLWLNQLSPIDGGNEFLGTNKELGSFLFEDRPDGMREFRAWDKDLNPLVNGTVPRKTSFGKGAPPTAYLEAARRSGTLVPMSTLATIPVASRPDPGDGPATTWAFVVDWRQCDLREVTPGEVDLRFGTSPWARRFEALRFTPALSFYSPSGVGQIVERIGDAPYPPTSQR